MISVIVVAHNDEDYLHVCLNSILKQDFLDFEIICVDDNSSDNSAEILEYFSKKDSRIKILKNKVYSGKGFSRNKCLDIAKGKYVLFLDGNDWISSNTLSLLIENAEKNNSEVLIFKSMFFNKKCRQFTIDSNYEYDFLNSIELKTFNHQDLGKNQLFDFPPEPNNKLYLKSFLDNNNIKFSNRFTKFEDISFFYKVMVHAKKISFLDEHFHIRHFRDNLSVEEFLTHNIQNSYLILDIFLQNRNLYNYYKKHLLNQLFVRLVNIYERINSNLKINFLNKIREIFKNFCQDYNLEEDILNNVNSDIISLLNDERTVNDDGNPKISIIVPAYNTGKYLNRCIDSILNQTFKNIEIICVNDGSTDNSLEILRDYEKKFSFIKIISQKNKGVSASRNIGLENVTGKYVYCLDSDDFLEVNALSELYRISEEECLDMVLFKLINQDEQSGKKYSTPYFDMDYLKDAVYNKVFNYKDIGRCVYRVPVTMQSTFFKSDLISNLRFVEGVIFEDNPFFIESLFNSNKVYFHDKYLCNKLNRQSSITNSSFEKFSDCIFISNYVFDLAKKYGHYDEFKDVLFYRKFNSLYVRYSQVTEEYKEDFFNKMRIDLINHKEEYENEKAFQDLDEKFKQFFYEVLKCKKYEELEKNIDFN